MRLSKNAGFRKLSPRIQGRWRLAILCACCLVLIMPWPVFFGPLNSLSLFDIPLGYAMVVILFPVILVFLLFWYAKWQEFIERQIAESDNR